MKHYPTFYTDEEREKMRQYEHEQSNRKAQGMICGNCKFYKAKANNQNEGRCLASVNGVKNTTDIFKNCGGGRIVYSHEIHRCYHN
jgi:hypothetical protein